MRHLPPVDKIPRSATLLAILAALANLACSPRRSPSSSVITSARLEATPPADLEAKLSQTFGVWEAARKILLERARTPGNAVDRETWESMLTDQGAISWSAAELSNLRAFHETIIADARDRPSAPPDVKLQNIRRQGLTSAYCRDVPKGGMLHLHPWGSLDRATVESSLARANPLLDLSRLHESLAAANGKARLLPEELGWLGKLQARTLPATHYNDLSQEDQAALRDLLFLPEGDHEFERFMGSFVAITHWIKTFEPANVAAMWQGVFARAAAVRIHYLEITGGVPTRANQIAGLTAWQADLRARYDVDGYLLQAFGRSKASEENRAKAQSFAALPESSVIVGFNLVENEVDTPALEQAQAIFATLQPAEGGRMYQAAIHAGELGDPRNVRDAVIMGAKRIGHGVLVNDDPLTLEYMRRRKLAIEVNLLSNLRLRAIPNLAAHPFLRYHRLGIPVSLSTDDEGIFETTLNDECVAAIDNSDVTSTELTDIFRQSILGGFGDADVRATRLAQWERELAEFELRESSAL